MLGAWRNIIESSILEDDDFPPGALLLAESLLSACMLFPLGMGAWAFIEAAGAGADPTARVLTTALAGCSNCLGVVFNPVTHDLVSAYWACAKPYNGSLGRKRLHSYYSQLPVSTYNSPCYYIV